MSARDPKPNTQESLVLAIDPGYDRVGIAIMKKNELIFSECYSPPKGALSERLSAVYAQVLKTAKTYRPGALALETLFFTKNQKTAIAVAEARGAIMLAAAHAGIPLFEYSPQAVKIAVTGSGNADKAAVIKMVERILRLPPKKRLDDEYDAIALAVAHLAQAKHP